MILPQAVWQNAGIKADQTDRPNRQTPAAQAGQIHTGASYRSTFHYRLAPAQLLFGSNLIYRFDMQRLDIKINGSGI